MSLASNFRVRGGFVALVSVVAFVLAASPAPAQAGGTTGPPGIDHYLIYQADSQPGPFPVILSDQFLPQTTHIAETLDYFGNPVSKNGEGIFDPQLHYTWWRLNPPRPFTKTLVASNQFGDQTLFVGDGEYLWNPALKNIPGPGLPIPVANHYLCYHASGQFVPRTVTLQDQFGSYQATVIAPDWFCTPVEKNFQGINDPIVRPEAHQVCYRIQPLSPFPGQAVTFLDEFRFGQAFLTQQIWLCVPTFKQDVTDADQATWGSVKAIYR